MTPTEIKNEITRWAQVCDGDPLEYGTLLKIFAPLTVANGVKDDHESREYFYTMRFPKREWPTRESFTSIGAYVEVEDAPIPREFNMFRPMYLSIPTNSEHDCTGLVCGVSRSVHISETEHDWWVNLTTREDRDL